MNPGERAVALANANAKRVAIAQMRKHVLAGRIDPGDLFLDPPEILAHRALIDVMALARLDPLIGAWREEIGKAAVRDGVNLLVPVGKASRVSREWAARMSPRVPESVARRRRELEEKARVSGNRMGAAA